MADARVVLVRHAETELNALDRYQARLDVPLNHTGEEQVRSASATLTPGRWAGVWSSPTLRARATAAPMARAVGRSTREHPELVERDLGELDGQDRGDHRRRDPVEARSVRTELGYVPRGGEALAAALVRLGHAVIEVVETAPDHGTATGPLPAALLLVTHGGVLNALGLHLLGQRPGQVHHVDHVKAVGLTVRTSGRGDPAFAAVHHWNVPLQCCEGPWPAPRAPFQALPRTSSTALPREV